MKHIVEATAGKAAVSIHQAEKVIALLDQGNTVPFIARYRKEETGSLDEVQIKAVEDAKEDGRWEQAYDSPVNMKAPEDFLKALSKNKKALAFFNTLNKTNLFAIGWRLQTAKKPERAALAARSKPHIFVGSLEEHG